VIVNQVLFQQLPEQHQSNTRSSATAERLCDALC